MKLNRNINFIKVLLFLFFSVPLIAQKIEFDPVDWEAGKTLKIKLDYTATAFHNFNSDLYIWTWVNSPNGITQNPSGIGTFNNSSAAAKLINLGNNKYEYSFIPTSHFNLAAEILNISGFNFLIKNQDGSQKTGDYGPIKPKNPGLNLDNCWKSTSEIEIIVDVNNTPLANSVTPLHYWGWYNNGTADINAANNGTWEISSSQSEMTEISPNVWKIIIDPAQYFGTNANNISSNNLFGLIKQKNGNNGKTGGFWSWETVS